MPLTLICDVSWFADLFIHGFVEYFLIIDLWSIFSNKQIGINEVSRLALYLTISTFFSLLQYYFAKTNSSEELNVFDDNVVTEGFLTQYHPGAFFDMK